MTSAEEEDGVDGVEEEGEEEEAEGDAARMIRLV